MGEYYQRQVQNIKRILMTNLEIKKKSKIEIVELASALGTQTMGTKESLVNNIAHKVTSLLLEDCKNSEKYTVEDYMQMPKFRAMAENSKEFYKLVIKSYKKQLKRADCKEAESLPVPEPIHPNPTTKPLYSFNPTFQNYNFIPLVQNNMNFNGNSGYHVNPMPSPAQVSPVPVLTQTPVSNIPIVSGYPTNLGFSDQLYSHGYPFLNSPYQKLQHFLPMGYQTAPQPQFPGTAATMDPRLFLANPLLNPMYQHLLNKQTQPQPTPVPMTSPTIPKIPEPPKSSTSLSQSRVSHSHTVKMQYIPPVKEVSNLTINDSKCICNGSVDVVQYSARKLVCQNCRGQFHQECMVMKDADESQKQNFECPSCTMKIMDPLKQVVAVLKEDIVNFDKLKDKMYFAHIKVDKYADLLKHHDKMIEIRCLKIDGMNQYDFSWPDCASLRINDEKPTEFKPLQYLSSVKKRKDNAVTVDSNIVRKTGYWLNIRLEMKQATKELLRNYRINEQFVYSIGVYVVSKLSPQTLIKNITLAKTDAQECKKAMIASLTKNRDTDLQIHMCSISLNDPFNLERLRLPARGKYCQHPQCFSLDTFILLMSHTPFPNWRCPVCRRRCFKMKIDTYVQEIMQRAGQEVTEVSFDTNGNYFFPKNKPILDIDDDEPVCKEDPKIQFD